MLKTKVIFKTVFFIAFIGCLLSCEKNEDELIDPNSQIENENLQSKSAPVYGTYINGHTDDPKLSLPNLDWFYTIQYKYDRTNGAFIQPDGIMYLKGAPVGRVEVITADQRNRALSKGWEIIDELNIERDEFRKPETRPEYQYLVIKYKG